MSFCNTVTTTAGSVICNCTGACRTGGGCAAAGISRTSTTIYPYPTTVSPYIDAARYGWLCSACGRSNAPSIPYCACGGRPQTTIRMSHSVLDAPTVTC